MALFRTSFVFGAVWPIRIGPKGCPGLTEVRSPAECTRRGKGCRPMAPAARCLFPVRGFPGSCQCGGWEVVGPAQAAPAGPLHRKVGRKNLPAHPPFTGGSPTSPPLRSSAPLPDPGPSYPRRIEGGRGAPGRVRGLSSHTGPAPAGDGSLSAITPTGSQTLQDRPPAARAPRSPTPHRDTAPVGRRSTRTRSGLV